MPRRVATRRRAPSPPPSNDGDIDTGFHLLSDEENDYVQQANGQPVHPPEPKPWRDVLEGWAPVLELAWRDMGVPPLDLPDDVASESLRDLALCREVEAQRASELLQLEQERRRQGLPVDSSSDLEDLSEEVALDSDPELGVEEILDKVFKDNRMHYLIKWQGYSHKSNTWEPEENLVGCDQALRDFERTCAWAKSRERKRERLPNRPQSEFKSDAQRASVEAMNRMLAHDKNTIYAHNYVDVAYPPENFVYIHTVHRHFMVPDNKQIDLEGCECVGGCPRWTDTRSRKEACACVRRAHYDCIPYNSQGRLNTLYMRERAMLHECNAKCRCPPHCLNRVIQHGSRINLQLFRTLDRGWGVRTLNYIEQGEYICEYVGELIDEGAVEMRGRIYDGLRRNYLFDLNSLCSEDAKYALDAAYYGNVTRFINHSCDPNMQQMEFTVNEHPSQHRLAFFAARSICAGEELTFDYEGDRKAGMDEDDHTMAHTCLCRSENCRGTIQI